MWNYKPNIPFPQVPWGSFFQSLCFMTAIETLTRTTLFHPYALIQHQAIHETTMVPSVTEELITILAQKVLLLLTFIIYVLLDGYCEDVEHSLISYYTILPLNQWGNCFQNTSPPLHVPKSTSAQVPVQNSLRVACNLWLTSCIFKIISKFLTVAKAMPILCK